MENTEKSTAKREELVIKFGKGLVGKPFMAKTGKECVGIKIPNADPADKTPWESIVVGANRVHEDKFGKGMWMKVSADGQTKVSRSIITGQDENGKNIWNDVKIQMPNKELKDRVEVYKTKSPQGRESETKESAREKLDALAKDTAEKLSADKPKSRPKSKGNER